MRQVSQSNAEFSDMADGTSRLALGMLCPFLQMLDVQLCYHPMLASMWVLSSCLHVCMTV